jgi:hypothetical protein
LKTVITQEMKKIISATTPNKFINHRHCATGQPKARFAHGCRL